MCFAKHLAACGQPENYCVTTTKVVLSSSGSVNLPMRLRSVVFPEPEWPRIATKSPFRTSRSTWSTALTVLPSAT